MKTAVVICPGRGTYSKTELGTLARNFTDRGLLARFDARRQALGQESLTALDGAASYSVARHSRGDNASALDLCRDAGGFPRLAGGGGRRCHRQFDGLVFGAGLRRGAECRGGV